MRTTRPIALAVLLLAGLALLPAAVADETAIRHEVDRLLGWLAGEARDLPAGLLPERGTIQMELRRLGAARGAVGARQAATILGEIRARGVRAEPGIVSVDVEGDALALVRARIRQGETGVALLLTLRREEDRWVLREIRESP